MAPSACGCGCSCNRHQGVISLVLDVIFVLWTSYLPVALVCREGMGSRKALCGVWSVRRCGRTRAHEPPIVARALCVHAARTEPHAHQACVTHAAEIIAVETQRVWVPITRLGPA